MPHTYLGGTARVQLVHYEFKDCSRCRCLHAFPVNSTMNATIRGLWCFLFRKGETWRSDSTSGNRSLLVTVKSLPVISYLGTPCDLLSGQSETFSWFHCWVSSQTDHPEANWSIRRIHRRNYMFLKKCNFDMRDFTLFNRNSFAEQLVKKGYFQQVSLWNMQSLFASQIIFSLVVLVFRKEKNWSAVKKALGSTVSTGQQ